MLLRSKFKHSLGLQIRRTSQAKFATLQQIFAQGVGVFRSSNEFSVTSGKSAENVLFFGVECRKSKRKAISSSSDCLQSGIFSGVATESSGAKKHFNHVATHKENWEKDRKFKKVNGKIGWPSESRPSPVSFSIWDPQNVLSPVLPIKTSVLN